MGDMRILKKAPEAIDAKIKATTIKDILAKLREFKEDGRDDVDNLSQTPIGLSTAIKDDKVDAETKELKKKIEVRKAFNDNPNRGGRKSFQNLTGKWAEIAGTGEQDDPVEIKDLQRQLNKKYDLKAKLVYAYRKSVEEWLISLCGGEENAENCNILICRNMRKFTDLQNKAEEKLGYVDFVKPSWCGGLISELRRKEATKGICAVLDFGSKKVAVTLSNGIQLDNKYYKYQMKSDEQEGDSYYFDKWDVKKYWDRLKVYGDENVKEIINNCKGRLAARFTGDLRDVEKDAIEKKLIAVKKFLKSEGINVDVLPHEKEQEYNSNHTLECVANYYPEHRYIMAEELGGGSCQGAIFERVMWEVEESRKQMEQIQRANAFQQNSVPSSARRGSKRKTTVTFTSAGENAMQDRQYVDQQNGAIPDDAPPTFTAPKAAPLEQKSLDEDHENDKKLGLDDIQGRWIAAEAEIRIEIQGEKATLTSDNGQVQEVTLTVKGDGSINLQDYALDTEASKSSRLVWMGQDGKTMVWTKDEGETTGNNAPNVTTSPLILNKPSQPTPAEPKAPELPSKRKNSLTLDGSKPTQPTGNNNTSMTESQPVKLTLESSNSHSKDAKPQMVSNQSEPAPASPKKTIQVPPPPPAAFNLFVGDKKTHSKITLDALRQINTTKNPFENIMVQQVGEDSKKAIETFLEEHKVRRRRRLGSLEELLELCREN